MLKTQDTKLKGQALVMVTLSLVAMCGMLGLATDMGWAYFVKKSAQRAADSAAQAAANQAYTLVGEGTYACTNVTCQTSTSCAAAPNNPPATNIDSGCLYAKQNGFATGGNGGHQNVTIESNVTTPAPTAPGIKVDYWATARVTESIPQLFSAVLQFPFATSSARATAAILDVVVPGSLYLLDRENDPTPNGKGDDLHMGGGGSVTVAGSAYMASGANGTGNQYAADRNGNASMTASYVGMRGAPSDPTAFTPSPAMNQGDGANYQDPMRGKG